jgi:hypothetical protein
LHTLEEVVIGVPGLRNVFDLVPRLLDQRLPDMVDECVLIIRHPIIAALFGGAVVAISREQRGLGVFLPLRIDDVADVE